MEAPRVGHGDTLDIFARIIVERVSLSRGACPSSMSADRATSSQDPTEPRPPPARLVASSSPRVSRIRRHRCGLREPGQAIGHRAPDWLMLCPHHPLGRWKARICEGADGHPDGAWHERGRPPNGGAAVRAETRHQGATCIRQPLVGAGATLGSNIILPKVRADTEDGAGAPLAGLAEAHAHPDGRHGAVHAQLAATAGRRSDRRRPCAVYLITCREHGSPARPCAWRPSRRVSSAPWCGRWPHRWTRRPGRRWLLPRCPADRQ